MFSVEEFGLVVDFQEVLISVGSLRRLSTKQSFSFYVVFNLFTISNSLRILLSLQRKLLRLPVLNTHLIN